MLVSAKGARNKTNMCEDFKAQENQRFSSRSLNQFCLKIEGLFQINFKLGRFFYLVKYDRTVILADIGNI
ncbi:hypothetical protein SAMN05880573_101123 [Chryseobacterium sp. RU33C]|nr:hypothetical protein SAMN05880573_101123 [Chryseobacterium sp. RU33C]